MNKARRKALDDIRDKLSDIHDLLQEINDEEECARDNLPESLQTDERQEVLDNLYSAISLIDEAMDCIDNARGESA